MTDVVRSYPHGLGGPYPSSSSSSSSSSSLSSGKDKDEKGRKGTEVFFCNPDLLWKANYAVPRFGQGAFKEAFQAVFKVRLSPLLSLHSNHPFLLDARDANDIAGGLIGSNGLDISVHAIRETA